jgi:hypothetical protein
VLHQHVNLERRLSNVQIIGDISRKTTNPPLQRNKTSHLSPRHHIQTEDTGKHTETLSSANQLSATPTTPRRKIKKNVRGLEGLGLCAYQVGVVGRLI